MTAPYKRLVKLVIFCLIFISPPATLKPQSHNREAVKWYRNALRKENLNARINALQKAIEFDPKYVEALLSLGRAHQGLQQFQQAKKYLKRAYTARLAVIDTELKSQILYELGSTYQYLNEMKACEDAFRGARNLTRSQALKSEISFELGKILYQRNQFEAAMTELSQCRQVKPEHEVLYNQLTEAAARAIELNKIYLAAEDAQLNGQVEQAKALYEKIDRVMPGFRDVQEKIDSLSSTEILQDIFEAPPANTRVTGTFKTNDSGTSVPAYDPPEDADGGTAEPENAVAVKRSGTRDTPPALPANDEPPDAMGAATVPPTAETLPARPVTTERPISRKVRHLAPTRQPILDSPPAQLVPRPRLTGHKDRPVAPQARSPQRQLRHSRSDNPIGATEVPEQPGNASRALLVSSLLTGALLLPLLGFILVSPVARARLFVLLGQRQRAAPIYESMLLKHPHRLWLYPALARLYYHENRQDAQAMRVYRMIKHLHSKNKYADSLTANIVNKYLSDVKTVPVQIEIVEQDRSRKRS